MIHDTGRLQARALAIKLASATTVPTGSLLAGLQRSSHPRHRNRDFAAASANLFLGCEVAGGCSAVSSSAGLPSTASSSAAPLPALPGCRATFGALSMIPGGPSRHSRQLPHDQTRPVTQDQPPTPLLLDRQLSTPRKPVGRDSRNPHCGLHLSWPVSQGLVGAGYT